METHQEFEVVNGKMVVDPRQWEDTLRRLKSSRQKNKNYRRAIKDLQGAYERQRHAHDTAINRANTYRKQVESTERANEILVKRVKELEKELADVKLFKPFWRRVW